MNTPSSSSSTTTYSERLGAIHPGQFQQALTRLGLGTFIAAAPTTSGMFGQNVFVTSSSGTYVLRGHPFDDNQLPRERFIARLISEQSVAPGPWPYLVDPTTDIFGWSYAIMKRLDGQRMESPFAETLAVTERRAIAQAFGTTLGDLGAVRLPACGHHDALSDAIRPSVGGWTGLIDAWLDDHLRQAERCSPSTIAADRRYIAPLVERGMRALEGGFMPTLCSSDYGENNAVVAKRGDHWVVSGIFDLCEWFAGDGELCLTRPAVVYAEHDPQLSYDFVAAYATACVARGQPIRPGFTDRLVLYGILDRFIFWNFGHDRNWFDPSHEFCRFAEPSLERIWDLCTRLAAADLIPRQ